MWNQVFAPGSAVVTWMKPRQSLLRILPFITTFLLVGCCDKAVIERCRADSAAKLVLLDVPGKQATGPMRLDIRAVAAAKVGATLIRASCVSGKGANAEVQVDWKVAMPEVMTVRATVGSGDTADKVWVESGPEGSGVTGPWLQDGALIQLRDLVAGKLLAEIRVVGLPCVGA